MNFKFKKPIYTKLQNQSGTFEPCYRFMIETSESIMDTFDPSQITNEIFLASYLKEYPIFYRTLLTSFLTNCSQYFAKAYTVETISKYFRHKIQQSENQESTELQGGVQIRFVPLEIQIFQGQFTLIWKVVYEPIIIDIPDFEEESAKEQMNDKNAIDMSATPFMNDVKSIQVNPTELEPIEDITSVVDSSSHFQMQDASRHYEKQRVKEAQLRARLAMYKAERAMSRYLEKYGDQVSDSDWTDEEDNSD